MKRRSTAQEKKLADDARLLRWWKAWHREQRDAVLAGPHGFALAELYRAIKSLEHIQPIQLVGLARCINWTRIDAATKLVTLHELNTAITRFRERHGEEPIDDALPGEPLRVFQLIRSIVMNQFPASAGEARPELIRQNSGAVK
jgi:hypothetical protein